jgi:gamma-glutamyltranspeptidase/glutathione hydrolase
VDAEAGFPPETIAELTRRGHEVVTIDRWSNGKVMGIRRDPERGVLLGAVSPRRIIGYALGW